MGAFFPLGVGVGKFFFFSLEIGIGELLFVRVIAVVTHPLRVTGSPRLSWGGGIPRCPEEDKIVLGQEPCATDLETIARTPYRVHKMRRP